MTSLQRDARVQEIEQRLAAATPGPWRECGHELTVCVCGLIWSIPADAPVAQAQSVKNAGDEGEGFTKEQADRNAALIANAPTDLRFLLDLADEYRSLRNAVNEDVSECSPTCNSHGHAADCKYVDNAATLIDRQKEIERLRDQVAALQAENTRLESALANHVHPIEEPIVTFSDGTALLRTDALTDDEKAYHRKYGVLSLEAQQELHDFADHLARKRASRSPVPSEREAEHE